MRILFTSDIHGSDRCWSKFLAAPKFYRADVIIVGGDITGKFVVPIIVQPDGTYRVSFMGERHLRTRSELEDLTRHIADQGSYAYETTEEEYAWLAADQSRIDDLFKRLVVERAQAWMWLAEERLAGSGVMCIVNTANDDFFELDGVLDGSPSIVWPEGRVVELPDGTEMISVGYGNITPWNCPRDIPESELGQRIQAVASRVRDAETSIFNLHVPPYDSGLDLAPLLDERLAIVATASGDPQMVPVGSTAVREAIERYQPLASLHGHIHESKGVRRLGRTTVANPGSQYQEGILDGVLVDVDRRRHAIRAQLVSG
jgi:Icc-related predicted phosphoesterase